MMVIFVSQCEKNALKKTRRVLDAFANRIGDNTWQTLITEDGLQTVKKMLRQTASKSTAVSCHWLRSRSRCEFLWVVGSKEKFNQEGIVPVNSTTREIKHYQDSQQWKTIPIIKYAATIAGLFHDFGKANQLFQEKLTPKKAARLSEPYRHEWVSLRLFQAFIGNKGDEAWLNVLSQVSCEGKNNNFFKDGIDEIGEKFNNPINSLPPFARLIAWLILSHHKLPMYPHWKSNSEKIILTNANDWLNLNFEPHWNSHDCKDKDRSEKITTNWLFEKEIPIFSAQWRAAASLTANKAKAKLELKNSEKINYLDDHLFTTHLARLCLMLADHHYSSLGANSEWQDKNYHAYANTDRKTKERKQKLDEHLIGVADSAKKISRALPKLSNSLQKLESKALLINKVEKCNKNKFGWQDESKNLAKSLSKDSIKQGFFGINMASTGKGKTLANAKIMFALSNETGRARFSVALGLRTLTLQTGREYREKLKLSDEELAIAVGGTAVKQLFENEQNKTNAEDKDILSELNQTGSESENDFIDPDLYVDYKGKGNKHSLSVWTRSNDNLEKLINAPVLVSTIDHLMPATEGTRGGKQIGPMLRLLTSDLVLDEPDDFSLEDLPALCRLVHWAGMLGSKVLLSTATMPPALANALFRAYHAGWGHYAKANIENWDKQITCAWFDEFNCMHSKHKHHDKDDKESFKISHEKFVSGRITNIETKMDAQRKAEIIDVIEESSILTSLAKTIQKNSLELHQKNHQSRENVNISVGLVRMSNINPLVAVAKRLLQLNVPNDTRIHYCVYHSRYPLAVRSYLENKLDKILNRSDQNCIWENPFITSKLENSKARNHLFVVLASPVAEVGRDHDYDWAVIEPSSMRSIIQIAGRVLRHRDISPKSPNIFLLNKNYKALQKKEICFSRPGFESKSIKMSEHDLNNILKKNQYTTINAIARIEEPKIYRLKLDKYCNLVEMEHKALTSQLFGGESPASVWWEKHPHWCGEVQKQQRFRNSRADESYYLILKENSSSEWMRKNENVYPPKLGEGGVIKTTLPPKFALGNDFWFDLDAKEIYKKLANDFDIDLEKVSRRFGEVHLIDASNDNYNYCSNFGLYQDIGDEK